MTMHTFLYQLIRAKADGPTLRWVDEKYQALQRNPEARTLYITFSSVARAVGKLSITLADFQQQAGGQLLESFQRKQWNLRQLVRLYFLLSFPHRSPQQYQQVLAKLFETAEVDELVTLYAALPLLPYPEAFVQQATEGIRTNISAVLDAIALDNPFSTDYLPEATWNQMVLKLVFMGRPLYQLYQPEKRNNPDLARMLLDFAHERWAAHRTTTPELWRFVAPYLNASHQKVMERVIHTTNLLERQAGLLACYHSQVPIFIAMLASYPAIKGDIEAERCTWESIGVQLLADQG